MKKLKSFTFGKGRRACKYPWDTYLDGSIYELTKGDDFEASPAAFRASAAQAAARRGLKLRSVIDGGKVIIQAYKVEE